MSEPGPDVGPGTLTKANAIVLALEIHGELNPRQIAELVHEPLSSTYRLVQSLVAIEWIEAGRRRGAFRLGMYFLRVGGRFEDSVDVRRLAFEPLRDLRTETGMTTFLCERRDTRAVCVERFDGMQVRSMPLQIGDALPLFVGAASLAILSFLPNGERQALLNLLAAQTPSAHSGVAELAAVVESTRQRGYASTDNEVTTGIADLAAPVFNHRGELVASVSISGLRAAVLSHQPELARHVLSTASIVSRRLGRKDGEGDA